MKLWILFAVVGLVGEAANAGQPNSSSASKPVLVIVNSRGNPKLKKISFDTLRKIYNCQITNWADVPGSDRTDKILAYAPDENSEVSRFFKRRVGNVELANCVTTVSGPQQDLVISAGLGAVPSGSKVKEVVQGIGIVGTEIGKMPAGVKTLEVADDNKKPARAYVAPTPETLAKRAYPLTP